MHCPSVVRVLLTAIVLCWSASAAAQGPGLAQARAMYEQARFDDALEILEAPPASLSASERPRWMELRVVVLFALRSDRFGDALMDLAILAPDHQLSPGLPPRVYSAFQLARAYVLDPAEANLARARALYYVADFGGSLVVLSAMHVPSLTRQQRIERMVLRSLALFAVNRRVACRDQLAELAELEPDHRFDRRVPPEFRALWDQVRGQPPRG